MWWLIKMIAEDEQQITFAYSRASRELDGRITYDKSSKVMHCAALSSGDVQAAVNRFFTHVYRLIRENDYQRERMIAIG